LQRGTAERHFMAKPFIDESGNGFHCIIRYGRKGKTFSPMPAS